MRGIAHDPQRRRVAGATVKLKSATSEWSQKTQTDQDGTFSFATAPMGDYIVTVAQTGFAEARQKITLLYDTSPVLHFQLKLSAVSQTAIVKAEPQESVATVDTVTPTTLVLSMSGIGAYCSTTV